DLRYYALHTLSHLLIRTIALECGYNSASTYALTNVTVPYALAIADLGWREALLGDPALARGLNTHEGHLTNRPVAEAHGLEAVPLEWALRA
ncbi:hypothetical protein ACWCSH_48360, partial [Streptosporangium sp. NPDC001682]